MSIVRGHGGDMSIMARLKATEHFHVAVAGSPGVDWRNYDTIYTERDMGLPQYNPEGYEKANPLNSVKNLKGRLLTQHGAVDDNVHPTQVMQLVDALLKAGKPFDLNSIMTSDGPRFILLNDGVRLNQRLNGYPTCAAQKDLLILGSKAAMPCGEDLGESPGPLSEAQRRSRSFSRRAAWPTRAGARAFSGKQAQRVYSSWRRLSSFLSFPASPCFSRIPSRKALSRRASSKSLTTRSLSFARPV
ncbi:MAG: prolyl oligopeptidase family serine peptidase [Candidatus Aminicenantes bacterium]|nr:prolyl oligopeptidase family serine peptidase [Candidatus Aminicenantes bacterium]